MAALEVPPATTTPPSGGPESSSFGSSFLARTAQQFGEQLTTFRARVNTWPPQIVGSVALAIFILIGALAWRFLLTAETRSSIISLDLPDIIGPAASPSPTVTTTMSDASPPPRPIAQGQQNYNIRSSNETGPKLLRVEISDFDPQPGQEQTFVVKVVEPANLPITAVTVQLLTDTKQTTHQLTFSSQTSEYQIWTGTWSTDDTHNYIYTAKVSAISSGGEGKVELSFR